MSVPAVHGSSLHVTTVNSSTGAAPVAVITEQPNSFGVIPSAALVATQLGLVAGLPELCALLNPLPSK